MATIVKPQVLVFQEFSLVPSEVTQPLRAHIAGPNADLHRYDDADEKPLINVGAYDKDDDTNYAWPERQPGSIVDQTYTRVFMDDAYLKYYEDLIGDASNGRGTVAPVSGQKNWVRSSTVSFKANGTSYPRSGLLYDRDVQTDDIVYIRGIDNVESSCDEIELWTKVRGFAADEVASSVSGCREDVNNQGDTAASAVITKTAGPDNCVDATADGAAYDGLEDGHVTEVYTIEVIKSGIAGCQAARLRVTSASGTDNEDEVTPADFGSPTTIGTRGLTVTFDNTGNASCSSEASYGEVAETQLVTGQKWQVTVSQLFYPGCCEAGGTYSGPDDDVYVVEVTKGGTFANLPEVTVTTTKGLDFSGPTTVTAIDTAIPIGAYGVTISFRDCPEQSLSSGSSVSYAGDNPAGLRTGDKFYITVVSAQNGPIRTLILDHDLPASIQDATDLDLKLFIGQDGLEIAENRISSPPNVNWEQETTQIVIKAGITAYDASWTNSGVPMAMPVEQGTLYIHYREWLQADIATIGALNDTADIDNIAGPLDEDNPLKWGVFKALQNSNGTNVKYTAVSDPTDDDAWQAVLDLIDGRDDIYNLVPLTRDRDVWDLWQGHVDSESSAQSGNWKGMFINLQTPAAKMLVGKSTADVQALTPTSTDGNVVMATLEDDPNASGTQYTLLSVPAANSNFITYGVGAGDIVRYMFTTDAWGTESYTEFVVDSVLSENSLLLFAGHSVPVAEPQKIEIWHSQEKDELVTELKGIAQSYSDRRVCAVWPDLVGVGGNTVEGYYLCCALAGLASGVVPHQPLTNIEVTGFDDAAARTVNFFSDSQLDDLDDGGVWIVQEDKDGRIHTRHALNTDVTDVNSREESIRRNVDAISYLFLNRLSPFIGRSNVTPSMLDRLDYEVTQAVEYLKSTGYTQELGPQLIDGVIRTGYPRIHPLLADRIQIVMDIDVPAPLNNIELHLVV
jgi:hypothetical protein